MAYFPKAREVGKTQGCRGKKIDGNKGRKRRHEKGSPRKRGILPVGHLWGISVEHPVDGSGGAR